MVTDNNYYRLTERFTAEQTVYVMASSEREARAVLRGEGNGELIGSTEIDQVTSSRVFGRVERVNPDDVPNWVKNDNPTLFTSG